MSYVSLLQQVEYLTHIAGEHLKFVSEVMYCEPWEIEGNLKPGTKYQFFVFNCENVEIQEQTLVRTYRVMIMDRLLKDKSNELSVLSDTEQSFIVFLNFFRNGLQEQFKSNTFPDMTVEVNPVIESFKEEFGDWCAGWQGTISITTENLNDPCFE